MYLLDSIVKNIGEPFRSCFAPRAVATFLHMYDSVSAQDKASMLRLLNTWEGLFPQEVPVIRERLAVAAAAAQPHYRQPTSHATTHSPYPTAHLHQPHHSHQPPYPEPHRPHPAGEPHYSGYGQSTHMGGYGPPPQDHYRYPHAPYPQHQPPPQSHAYPNQYYSGGPPHGAAQPTPRPPPHAQPSHAPAPAAEVSRPSSALKKTAPKTTFTPAAIKEFDPDVVSALYSKIEHQCPNCALRFGQREELSAHMDWHFQRNKRENEKKSVSRGWYLTESAWVNSKGSEEASASAEESPFFEESLKASTDGTEKWVTSADDSQDTCPVCEEKFNSSYDSDNDEWVYVHTLRSARLDNKILHVDCATSGDIQAHANRLRQEAENDDSDDDEVVGKKRKAEEQGGGSKRARLH